MGVDSDKRAGSENVPGVIDGEPSRINKFWTDQSDPRLFKLVEEWGKPSGMGLRVVIQEDQHLAAGCFSAFITCRRKSRVAAKRYDSQGGPRSGEFRETSEGFVGRGVIDNDYFEGDVWSIGAQSLEAPSRVRPLIEDGDYDRNYR
jgi:hypothetical protein